MCVKKRYYPYRIEDFKLLKYKYGGMNESVGLVALLSVVLAGAPNASGGAIATASASIWNCADSATNSPYVFAGCGLGGPQGADAEASATVFFGSLDVSAAASTRGPDASAFASGSYDEFVVITGGVGSDILTGTYTCDWPTDHADFTVWQGGVAYSGNMCRPTGLQIYSPFTYGVPFEMKADAWANAWAYNDNMIDNHDSEYASVTLVSLTVNGQAMDFSVVPEPSAGLLVAAGLGLLAALRRIGSRLPSPDSLRASNVRS